MVKSILLSCSIPKLSCRFSVGLEPASASPAATQRIVDSGVPKKFIITVRVYPLNWIIADPRSNFEDATHNEFVTGQWINTCPKVGRPSCT